MNKNKFLSLDGLKKYDKLLKSYIALSNKTLLDEVNDSKQDKIDDLEEIREGASLGKTALQEVPSVYVTEEELAIKEYATTAQVEDLIDDAVIAVSNEDIDNLFK